MTGLERVSGVLSGRPADRAPVVPILHSGLAPLARVPLGRFLTDAHTMARVIVDGYHRFGYDGVQLSLGVTGEAEALGARVDQPDDASPVLRQHLLADDADLDALRGRDPCTGGRMPMFADAVQQVVETIGAEAFVLATLRGPLLTASQLRGVEDLLVDMIERPDAVARVLDFTTEVAVRLGRRWLDTGAHGVLLGEATCSPNFISPALYRDLVHPHHQRLVSELKRAGWQAVGLHICGGTLPIIDDVVATGVDFMDVDYQVPAGDALARVGGRMALRGNLDPSALFRFGTPDDIRTATADLCAAVRDARWITSSGCDIPPGTPAENIAAFVQGATGQTP